MAFCKNCGNQLPDDASFCANCGTPVDNSQQAETQQTYQQAAPQQTYQQAAPQQPVQAQVMDTDAPLPGEKGLAWLAYVLWAPAFLVPLFVKKASPYCQFHVKQGATLWAVHIAYYIVQSIIGAILGSIVIASRYNGGAIAFNAILSVLLWAGDIFLIVLAIMGIVNAATGKKKELPLISKIPWVAMLIDKIYAAINK